MNINDQLNSPWAYDVDPNKLDTFEQKCKWLEAMLSGPCGIFKQNGEPSLLNQRALIARVHGLGIVINPKEHSPPHFHVKYSGNNISIAISDCSILKGKIGNREYELIKYWYAYSKKDLVKKWNETRPTNCVVGKIKE